MEPLFLISLLLSPCLISPFRSEKDDQMVRAFTLLCDGKVFMGGDPIPPGLGSCSVKGKDTEQNSY
jgi:hypothetical protein